MGNEKIRALVLITMLCVTGVTAIGMVSAQEAGNTPIGTSTPTNDQVENESVITKISSAVTLVDYRFNDDTIIVTLQADYSQPVVLSDMFVSGSGAQKVPQKDIQLSTGTNEIRFDTTVWKGTKGVVIGTTDGAVAISEESGGFSFTSEYPGESLIGMGIVGIITGIGLVMLIAYKKELDYTSEVTQEL